MTIWTVAFWIATGERAIKSAAQGLLILWVVSDAGLFNMFDININQALGIAGGMAILSVLTSIVSAPVGGNGPSLAGETLARKSDAAA